MPSIQDFQDHVNKFAQSELRTEDLIANFTLGLSGETGEVADLLKKVLYHGDPLDREELIKELGDVLWYWFALVQVCELDVETIMQTNIDKLQARHGGSAFNRELQRINKAQENARNCVDPLGVIEEGEAV